MLEVMWVLMWHVASSSWGLARERGYFGNRFDIWGRRSCPVQGPLVIVYFAEMDNFVNLPTITCG